ncbi:MAG: glycosyltransferase [Clostridia bacterium]|nr:glycosyltransferase [Clostridia bacterium]
MKKIHIGLFVDTFYPMIDGVINVVDNYAKNLLKYADVTVFAPYGKDKKFVDNFPYRVIRCGRLKLASLDYDYSVPQMDTKFKKELKNSNLDIVHFHSPFNLAKVGIAYAKKHKIPVVATMHSQYERDFMKATQSKVLTKWLLGMVVKNFNSANVVYTMNQACVDIAKSYGIKTNIDIISNATEIVNNYSATEKRAIKKQIRKNYNIKDNEIVLLSIGRLNKIKNLDFTIEVCKVLKEKGFAFKLLMIGDGGDKEYFEEKVEELNLQDKIKILGKIDTNEEKNQIIMASDLHIFPSFYDTDGIVRIEAAAFYVPTIFIENSTASSTINKNIDGYIGKNDKNLFANQIIKIFKDKEAYKNVCINAYKNIYSTWEKVVRQMYENYLKLIEENKIRLENMPEKTKNKSTSKTTKIKVAKPKKVTKLKTTKTKISKSKNT